VERRGFATEEERQQALTLGLSEGKGISPSGRPSDFTADEKPPPY
jgi:hypothetical protein